MSAFELLKAVAAILVAVAVVFWILLHVPLDFMYGPSPSKPALETGRRSARPRLWPMMLARAIIVAFMVWLLSGPTRMEAPSPLYPHPDASKAAALVAIVVIVVDTLWDIVRRWKR